MGRLGDTALIGGERTDATEHLVAGIARLNSEINDASSYLPAYDQRTYGEVQKLTLVVMFGRAQTLTSFGHPSSSRDFARNSRRLVRPSALENASPSRPSERIPPPSLYQTWQNLLRKNAAIFRAIKPRHRIHPSSILPPTFRLPTETPLPLRYVYPPLLPSTQARKTPRIPKRKTWQEFQVPGQRPSAGPPSALLPP